MTMVYGHELFIAVCPPSSIHGKRDLKVQPLAPHRRLYNREKDAWAWLHEFDPNKPKHPGFVLEVHLDHLFQRTEGEMFSTEPRYVFHEREMQEHAALAARYQDGRASTLLDANDLQVLRAAAERWLMYEGANPKYPSECGLASVLRALLHAGKLGGGR